MSIASKDLFVVVSIVVPVLGGIFLIKRVDESQPFCYIKDMTKEECIRRYGIEEYKKRLEESKRYHNEKYKNDNEYKKRKKENQKKYRENENARQLEKYRQRRNDPAWREKYNEKSLKYANAKKLERGDAARFVDAQYRTSSRQNITDWKQYNLDILENEAINVDHNKSLLDEDFLYEHFVDNVKTDMYYGNVQVLKYFVPLMCIKLYDNKEFTEHNLEMIKYFDTFDNSTKKKPITYNKVLCYMPRDVKNDNESNIKYMLLYNLSANFIKNCIKYPTEKKLY